MGNKFITLNTPATQRAQRLKDLNAEVGTVLSEQASRNASFESSADMGVASMESIASSLGQALEGHDFTIEAAKNPAGLAMASFIATLGDKSEDYMRQYSQESAVAADNLGVLAFSLDTGFESVYSTESFDNQILGKYRDLSVQLNYNIGKQMDAMELMYRTVAVSPEKGGIQIDVPNLFIQNVLERNLSGRPTDYDYRRVMDAYIDPTILNDDGVQLIPQHNAETSGYFVETALSGTWEEVQGGRRVVTGFLKTGKEVDIVAIGHLDRVDRIGNPDYTDALDRSVGIGQLLMVIGDNKLVWDVTRQPFTRYVPSTEHGARRMIMDYVSRSLTLSKDSVDQVGDELTGAWFDIIKNNDYKVRLKVTMSGTADVEQGKVSLVPTGVSVASIYDANDELVDTTTPAVKALVDAIESATIPGWTPDARVTNSNLRHIGMLIAHRATKEILVTRTRAPFFYAFPVNEERDASPVEDLTAVVRAYTNNEGIKHMMEFHERAMRQTGGVRGMMTKGNFEDNVLTVEGIARHIVNPYIEHYKINVKDQCQSTETKYNLENGKEVILNQLRAIGFDILQNTNIENAARLLNGPDTEYEPKFALITSKEIEQFLTVKGDSRTLGAGLTYEIRSDVNQNLKGKIYLGLVRDTPANEIDVLSNGVCLQTPTMITQVTSWRGGKNVNELLVQPRFNHYQLLPIMVRLDVEGIEELLEQLVPFRVDTKRIDSDAGTGNTGPGTVNPGQGGTGGSGTGAGTNP